MNRIISVLALLLCSCACIKPDLAPAPASLEQSRTIIKTNGAAEAGISGSIDPGASMDVRIYGPGSVSLRGLGECGFITSGSADRPGWIRFELKDLPQKELCLYAIESRVEGFDSPSVGHFLVRYFNDPNVLPLKTSVNLVERHGVNWVQLREDQAIKSSSTETSHALVGIKEDREIKIFLNGNSGRLNITGRGSCQLSETIEYSNAQVMVLSVDRLYRDLGGVKNSCIFTITANHREALKESATVFIKVYRQNGSFLDAPSFKTDALNRACFKFNDDMVAGIQVNSKYSQGPSVCVRQSADYTVEGVTSRHRIFYGKHNGEKWEEMK